MPKLEDLLFDPNQVDKEVLAEILLPYIGIEKDSGKITFKDEWGKLSNKHKVLVYLLARKALVVMQIVKQEEEAQGPAEIEARTGIKGGSLRPSLMGLRREGLVDQCSEGYFVPAFKLQAIHSQLTRKN
ncbi:MAG: hypothetical protein AB1556_13340 [Bacillota bacterium]